MIFEFDKPNYSYEHIVINGISGSGKTALLPFIGSMSGVQPPKYLNYYEYLLINCYNSEIKALAGNRIIKMLIKELYMDNSLSRNINFRPSDITSVFKTKKGLNYIFQLFSKREYKLLDTCPLIVTHHLIEPLEFFLRNYYEINLKVIEIVRNPFDLLSNWIQCIKLLDSNKNLTLMYEASNNLKYPWYASKYKDKFINCKSNEDKVLLVINKYYENLFKLENKKILILPFESFVLERSNIWLSKIESFMGYKFNEKKIKMIKKEQNIPRSNIHSFNVADGHKDYQGHGFNFKITNKKLKDEFICYSNLYQKSFLSKYS